MSKKEAKAWSPTLEHIKSMIMASRQGYGLTEETNDSGKVYHLILWRDGKEEARFTGADHKTVFYLAYAEMVRKGRIQP